MNSERWRLAVVLTAVPGAAAATLLLPPVWRVVAVALLLAGVLVVSVPPRGRAPHRCSEPQPDLTANTDDAARRSARMIAHEVRNPLTSARAHVDLLLAEASLAEEHRRTLGRTAHGIDRAVRLLGELTRDESGEPAAPRRSEDVDVVAVVAASLSDIAPLAGRRRVSMSLDSPESACVPGDVLRLHQVVDNLLSNAVKYNDPEGWVDVVITRDDKEVMVQVTNPGVPLEEDEVARAFDDEFRGAATALTVSGSGTGLAVVHRIIQAHDGTVELRSEAATRTTTVCVRLPVAP